MAGNPPHFLQRRQFLVAGAGLALGLAGAAASSGATTPARSGIEAIGFDMFTIFDPRGVDADAEVHFPGKGSQIATAWRARIFDYCWLRTLTGTYADFQQVLTDALDVTLAAQKLDATAAARQDLVASFSRLKPYPDSVAALTALHGAGLRMAPLAQLTEPMLRALCDGAGIGRLFEHYLSTDRVQAYKPDPRAYAMAEQAFGLPRDKVAFAAFGGWDAAGAKAFGLKTYWVNRFGVPAERLGVWPDGTGATLTEFQGFVLG